MKDEVDPKRFTGKAFTRRKASPDSKADYAIVIDGLIAGRIMKKTLSFQRVTWFWSLTAPYFPVSTPQSGEEESFETARDAFKKLFWERHAWALKQPGKVTCYGAKK